MRTSNFCAPVTLRTNFFDSEIIIWLDILNTVSTIIVTWSLVSNRISQRILNVITLEFLILKIIWECVYWTANVAQSWTRGKARWFEACSGPKL